MPNTAQWDQTELGRIATFTNGGAWKAGEYVEKGIPVVRVSDCKDSTVDLSACKYLPELALDRYSEHQLVEGDLVIATVGSHPTQPASAVGRPIVVPREASGALLNQNAVCVRPRDESLNKRFLSCLARGPSFREYIMACARGSANQVRMAIGLLKKMPVTLPPLPTQRRIASILSAYDGLIENNLRRIKILEEMAQNLYREWFVKFRFPGHENVRFVDSPLGKIPEGWEVLPVSQLLVRHIGGGWGKEHPDSKHSLPAHVIRGTDIPKARQLQVDGCPLRYHSESNLRTRRLEVGELIYEVSGGSKEQPVGRTMLVTDRLLDVFPGDVICASFCKRMTPDPTVLRPLLLFHHLDELYSSARIDQYQVQSTGIKNFKFAVFLENEFLAIPPAPYQDRFITLVSSVKEAQDSFAQRNTILRHTRDLLLPKLISGELDVSELDICLESI